MTDVEEARPEPTSPRYLPPPSTRAQWLSGVAAVFSAVAAIGSLLVALLAWQTNREGQRRQLQPYVSVLSATLVSRADNSAAIRVVFENSGATPALSLATECYTVVTDSDAVSEEDFPRQGTKKPATANLAPHHQGNCLVGLSGMPGWHPSDLAKGQLVAGVRTYISYRDEFGQKHNLVFTAATGGRAGVEADGRLSVIGANQAYTVR